MEHWIWNVDPKLLQLGPFTLRWYGLFFATAFLLGYRFFVYFCDLEAKPRDRLDSLLLYMVAGTVIGSRLGHCLFYEPHLYLSNPLEIFKVWRGGLASHGGVIGIALALYLFSRKERNFDFLWTFSRISLLAPLGGFFIRTGNFFNSEIIGKPSELPWAVVFKRIDALPRHPTQIYEALAYLCIFLLLLFIYRREAGGVAPPKLLGLSLVAIFSFRFVVEFFKEVQVPFEQGMPLDLGQLLSLPVVALGVLLLVRKGSD